MSDLDYARTQLDNGHDKRALVYVLIDIAESLREIAAKKCPISFKAEISAAPSPHHTTQPPKIKANPAIRGRA
jgi:hypothetical protein